MKVKVTGRERETALSPTVSQPRLIYIQAFARLKPRAQSFEYSIVGWDTGVRHLGCLLLASEVHYQGAGLEVEPLHRRPRLRSSSWLLQVSGK